jgi:hypothetical protein
MKIQFLGCGGAFDWQFGNSAALLDFRGRRYLLDCGHTVFTKLMELGLLDTVDALLLTHLHDDHCGSAGTFLFAQHYLVGKKHFPVVVATPQFLPHLQALFGQTMVHLPQYIQFVPAQEIEGLTVLDTTGLHVPDMPTHAYLFEADGQHLLFSGDIGDAHFCFTALAQRNLQGVTVFHDLSFFEVATHAHYRQLAPYGATHQVYGYHHNPLLNPPDNPIPLVHNTPHLRLY